MFEEAGGAQVLYQSLLCQSASLWQSIYALDDLDHDEVCLWVGSPIEIRLQAKPCLDVVGQLGSGNTHVLRASEGGAEIEVLDVGRCDVRPFGECDIEEQLD